MASGGALPKRKLQRYYVLKQMAPFEEDFHHEFKGHTNLCVEEIPANAYITHTSKRSRQPVSKCLNGFLNTGKGGTVYMGITDDAQVKGLHLTQYMKDHLVAALDDLMTRYTPPVEPHRYKIRFVPAIDHDVTEEEKEKLVNYDSSKDADIERRKKAHHLRQSHYCWCHKDAVAQSNMGIFPVNYVAEITIRPWDPSDSRNKHAIGQMKAHPIHQDECGKTYFRRMASMVQYTPQELQCVSKQVVQEHYEKEIKEMKAHLAHLRAKALEKTKTGS